MTYRTDSARFGQGPSLIDVFREKKNAQAAKFNIKLRKSDLRVVDIIAAEAGTTRSHVLNALIDSSLHRILAEVGADDIDSAALIAKHADRLNGLTPMARGSWSDSLFAGNMALENYYANLKPETEAASAFSEEYLAICERLRGGDSDVQRAKL